MGVVLLALFKEFPILKFNFIKTLFLILLHNLLGDTPVGRFRVELLKIGELLRVIHKGFGIFNSPVDIQGRNHMHKGEPLPLDQLFSKFDHSFAFGVDGVVFGDKHVLAGFILVTSYIIGLPLS